MKRFFTLACMLLGCIWVSTDVARGQNAANGAAQQFRLMQVEPEALNRLDNLAAQRDVGAVSLEASLAQLRARPTALRALSTWVSRGGVVFLHTDAAQLFGYETVPARETTARVAGQLFGRAEAALPFGAHPLLWGATGSARANNAATAGARGALGVRRVYYQMASGDHLVAEHPAGVPLLQVTDLAAPATEPLYAAAIAPYGNGWAVFTPSLVEQHRADGAVFVQNLWRLALSSPQVIATQAMPTAASNMLVSVPAAVVEAAADELSEAANGNFDAAPLARELARALRATGTAATTVTAANAVITAPRLMLTRGEAGALAAALNAAPANNAARARVGAAVYLLRARVELQRNEPDEAADWLELAEELAPNAADTLLWRGIVSAGLAENQLLNSQARAALLSDAAARWARASGATALLTPVALPAFEDDFAEDELAEEEFEEGEFEEEEFEEEEFDGAAGAGVVTGASISGISVALVQSWSDAAAYTARLMSAEPPLVTPLGNPGEGVILRHFADDPTLRLALAAGELLNRSSSALGWRAPDEEIVIFPVPAYYEAYRRAAGLPPQVIPNTLTQHGDVVGSRILMVSQATLPIILPPAAPGQPPRPVQFGTAVPAVLGRLHAYVLMNALAQGGEPIPEWMQIGLMSLSNLNVVTGVSQTNALPEALRDLAAAGGLLTPQQFQGAMLRTETAGLAEAQATRLMMFFYSRYGAGRVVETLQRLGAGQTFEEALEATTGLTEEEFFLAWRNAEFGVRFR